MWVFIIFVLWASAPAAYAWQLAVGGGLTAGDVAGAAAGPAEGWQIMGQWAREPVVGERWLVDLGVGQFATRGQAQGVLERGRAVTGLVLWERRLPLSYRIRPWWGVGVGVTRLRYDERLQLNSQGYAVSSDLPVRSTDLALGGTVSIPINHSWQAACTFETTWPSRLSTITLTLLWRLL